MRRVLLITLLAACTGSNDFTRLHAQITSPSSLDAYSVHIAAFSAFTQPQSTLDLVVPDSTAGQPEMLQIWGVADNQQVAFGQMMVTPLLHQTVNLDVSLAAIACGTPCTLGQIECSSDGTITCEADTDGCLAWSPVMACPTSEPDCSNGTCAATCSDECSLGQTECDTPFSMRTCGQFDSDPCLDWSAATACPSGQTCTNGACGTPVSCGQDGDSCSDGNPCTVDDECDAGTCSGVPKCTTAPANAMPTCASDGTCGFACNPGFVKSGTGCIASDELAAMPTARFNLVAATAPGGTIYAIGGQDATGAYDTTVEAYAPSTNAWTTRAPLPSALSAAAAATGADGMIYVMGGLVSNGTSVVATTLAYDPVHDTWTTRAAMPTARAAGIAVTGTDGTIYSIGGQDASGIELATVEAYSPAGNSWSTRASLPVAVGGLAAALGSDGKIYVFGGVAASGDVATVYAYDPTANTWTARASLPVAIQGHGGAAVGGTVFSIGGEDGGGGIDGTNEAYSVSGNAWAARTAMPTPRYGIATAVSGNQVYVIGGAVDAFNTPTGTLEAYNPSTDTWR